MYPSNPEATRAKIMAIVERLIKLGIPPARAMEQAAQIAKKGMEGLAQEDTGGWEFRDRLNEPGELFTPDRPRPKLPRPIDPNDPWGRIPPGDWGSPGDVMPPRDFPPDEGIRRKIPEDWKKRLQEYFKRDRDSRPMAAEGGLMNLGGMEKDYRQEGGFVPIGGEEKADDVPARLSKNEFVFTADAVRAAGGGDIDAGAEVMENLMENLEIGRAHV